MNELIKKTIKNNENKDIYVGDVLLYELNDLSEVSLSKDNCFCFRSGRNKNDLPSVFKFGNFDDSFKDAMTIVKETGDDIKYSKDLVIISDGLTILGTDEYSLFIGFNTSNSQLYKVLIYLDNDYNFKSLKVFVTFNCYLKSGDERTTEELVVKHSTNLKEDIKSWAINKTKGLKVKTKKPLSVYSTWYYYGTNITFNDCLVNLEKINENNLKFDVFEIDDGWEKTYGDWTCNSKFPPRLEEITKIIKNYNLIPGIWTSPFVVDDKSNVLIEHPSWILKDINGNDVLYEANGYDYRIIDITIKETLEYFKELYRNLYNVGFRYFKLDFTRAPITAKNPLYHDKYSTIVESYINAFKAIKEGITNDSFLSVCGGLYDPLIGIADSERTGSDCLSMWTSTINKNGKTLPYTIKQNLLRYYYNYFWYNDPDALMVRRNKNMINNSRLTYGLFNDEEVKTATINQLLGSGIVSSTEPLDIIDKDRLLTLNHVLPIRETEVLINNILSIGRYPKKILLKEKNNKNSLYLVLINFDDNKELNEIVEYKDFNLKGNNFYLYDFYSRKEYNDLNINFSIRIDAIKPHSSTILKLTTKKQMIDFESHYLM